MEESSERRMTLEPNHAKNARKRFIESKNFFTYLGNTSSTNNAGNLNNEVETNVEHYRKLSNDVYNNPHPDNNNEELTDNDLSTNISEWFNNDAYGEDIKIFSDYEGTTTTQQIENVKAIFKEGSNQKCIYLGDVFDNANFGDKTIDQQMKGESSDCIKTENYCALTMLKLFIDNPDKCRYVVGNRDINKLKLYPLLQFADGSKWWEEGATYEAIISNLLSKTKLDDSLFLINSMEYYVPFWKGDLTLPATCKPKSWVDPVQLSIGNLYNRYQKIFGADCKEGTISAEFTIMGLPNELFKEGNEGEETIKNIIERLQSTYDVKEIRAAIVFTVFMRMLDKELWNTKNTENKDKKLSELGALDGYLYKYLSRAYPSFYAEDQNNLYLFAHGGITGGETMEDSGKLFLNNSQNAFDILSNIKWNKVFNKTTDTDIEKYNELVDTPTEVNTLFLKASKFIDNNCIDRITKFNNLYFEYINYIFDFFTFNKIIKNNKNNITRTPKHSSLFLIVLLALSAPTEASPTIKSEGLYISDLSPIQARLPIESQIKSEKYGTNAYDKVYNFCGHASSAIGGYGMRKLDDNTIFINTDYSTTLFKKDLPCNKDFNINHLMMTLSKDRKFSVSGDIMINNNLINTEKSTPPVYTKISYNKQYSISDDDMTIPETFKMDKPEEDKVSVYNGIGVSNNETYKIYSNYNKDTKKSVLHLEEIKSQIVDSPLFGGSSYSRKTKKSCKKKSCKNRNCKKHNTKKNHTKKYKKSNKNTNNYKYKNKNT